MILKILTMDLMMFFMIFGILSVIGYNYYIIKIITSIILSIIATFFFEATEWCG